MPCAEDAAAESRDDGDGGDVPPWLAADVAAARETERAESARLLSFLVLLPAEDLRRIRDDHGLLARALACLPRREHREALHRHLRGDEAAWPAEAVATPERAALVRRLGTVRPVVRDGPPLLSPEAGVDAEFIEARIGDRVARSGLVDVGRMPVGEALDGVRRRERSIAATRLRSASLAKRERAGGIVLPFVAEGLDDLPPIPDISWLDDHMAGDARAPAPGPRHERQVFGPDPEVPGTAGWIERCRGLPALKAQVAFAAVQSAGSLLAERIKENPGPWKTIGRFLETGHGFPPRVGRNIGHNLLARASREAPEPGQPGDVERALAGAPDPALLCALWTLRLALARVLFDFELPLRSDGDRFRQYLLHLDQRPPHRRLLAAFDNWHAALLRCVGGVEHEWTGRLVEARRLAPRGGRG